MHHFFSDRKKDLVQIDWQSRRICVRCRERANYFRDKDSKSEWIKNGLCQDCQDKKYNYFNKAKK